MALASRRSIRTIGEILTRSLTAAVCLPLSFINAADRRGDNPDAQPLSPEEQLKHFTVPPGFEVQLVASEPQIQKPINLNFDAAGRLWATGSESYPWPVAISRAPKLAYPMPSWR